MTSKEADILRDLWRFSVSERYTDEEIRKALDKAIETMKKDRQHGKWKKIGTTVMCSVCEHGWGKGHAPKDLKDYNFCPNCGADMREGEK